MCQYLHPWNILKFVQIITFFTVQGKYCCRCACHGCMWRSGCRYPCIFNLCLRWRWVVSFTPWLLYHREKGPPIASEQGAKCASKPIWTFWRDQSLALAGNWTMIPQMLSLLPSQYAIMAPLHTVLYKYYIKMSYS